MNKKDWLLHLTIEGITPEQADKLMDIIIAYAEAIGTFVGGGIAPMKDEENEQEQNA